ncbi:hypothetical protein LK09_19820 [Microbacterium mangrovi]|uniref:Uncharacterized protein n=1 Tax=Microbacterium mangrovi TaxID=1348253 RepID=A0A0B1ZWN8_9MICO|nr:hypothetical protein [Microbacterium mangrovi]KHK95159.1 hypothetical protein LK09_19820 [Microbacterium mangrovi]
MRWTGDVAAGDWLKPLIDDPWRHTMHDVVPRGFEAYARVFHPASRSRPVGQRWPRGSIDDNARGWQKFSAERHEIESESVSWAQVADAFGTTMHPYAQFRALVGQTDGAGAAGQPEDAAGWHYGQTMEGQLDAGVLSVLAGVLSGRTTTPDSGGVALWDGWGDLVGGLGYGGSRSAYVRFDGDDPEQGVDFIAQTTRDWFNDVFRPPTWQDGILSREISKSPRLELPGRSFVVFEGGIREFTSPDWESRVPWLDVSGVELGFPPSAYAPSIIWPDDHAWVLVSEVDYDSTIIAGSRELIRAVCSTPGVEALPIAPDSALTWDSDEVNR